MSLNYWYLNICIISLLFEFELFLTVPVYPQKKSTCKRHTALGSPFEQICPLAALSSTRYTSSRRLCNTMQCIHSILKNISFLAENKKNLQRLPALAKIFR